MSPNEIYTELSKFYPNNHKIILENLDFVASLLSQQGADMLGYLLERIDFNDNERMKLYNEMKNIIASDHIIIENIDLFFSIVNILMQKLKIDFQSEIGDNNEVIKGLEKYEKYSSLELLKLQSKLSPEKLIDIFESTFAEITSDQHNFYGHRFNNLDNKLSDILAYFGELDNDDVLKQIYSSDKWPKIIDTCIKTNQTDSVVKIADFIIKKPITSESRKVLFLIFTGSHELNHVVKFSSHISSFLPYSNSEEVFGLFNIIVVLMNDPSRNREKDLAFQTLISAFMNFISSHKNEERLKELYILPELALKHAVLIRDSMFLIYVNFLSLIAELNKTFCMHTIELLNSKFNNPKKEDDLFVFAAIRFKLYFCEKGTSKDAILTSLRFIYDKAAKGFIQQNQNLFFLVLTSTKFEDWIIDFAESVFLDPAIPISSPKEEEWLIKAIKLMKGEKLTIWLKIPKISPIMINFQN
ncbi:hypothetical protein TRFO_19308 [Tritrichomonas foetus]|uniref:Uncharacterized protein n=1 Tax=Tritrichomonas foetus TaxID=1144522 RepID=A0A1J4KJC5_9EUKA|nr:hypothetical protein TRFO_19308 [Tritrichomonas foetus]|eukprot:OHT11323.1 hypothetical protein TRFO_19308 [Tritrichomonas foetus]